MLCAAVMTLPFTAVAQGPSGSVAPACGAPLLLQQAHVSNLPTVAVIYFAGGSTQGDDPQLAHGITNAVMASLSRAGGLNVVPGDQFLRASQSKSYLLTGNVRRLGSRMIVRVRLNEAHTGETRWSTEITRTAMDIPGIGAEIAAEVANRMGGVADTTTAPRVSIDPSAYDQLLLGDYSLTRWDNAAVQRASRSLALAAGLSGGSHEAFALYARALGKMGEWGYPGDGPADSMLTWGSAAAELAGSRALQAGDTALAARTFGNAAVMAALHGDAARARTLASRATSLDRAQPAAARARALIALPQGTAAAARELRSAWNTLDVAVLLDAAMLAMDARRDSEACQLLDTAIANDPLSAPAFALRSLLRLRMGDMRGGWADAEMTHQLGRPTWGEALDILAASRTSASQELLGRVQRFTRRVRADSSELSVIDARLTAIALSAAGEPELARSVLARMRQSDPRRSLTLGEALARR